MAGASSKSKVVYFAWWPAFAAIALVSALVLYALLGITSWPLLEEALALAFLISLVVLRRLGRTLLESILIATLSIAAPGFRDDARALPESGSDSYGGDGPRAVLAGVVPGVV
jgi:hypothetical protein